MDERPYYHSAAFIPYLRRYRHGESVFVQGATDGQLCVLVRGALEVRKDGRAVGRVEEPGALVGEMALVLGQAHTADVLAAAESEIAVIPRQDLRTVLAKIPEFSLRVMRTLAQRLEETNARLAELEDRCDNLFNQVESETVSGSPAAQGVLLDTQQLLAVAREGGRPAGKIPGERSALWRRDATCAAHGGPEVFPLHLLRTGTLRFTRDFFDLTEYTVAEPGYAAVDYTLQEVQVCPVCHFAVNAPDAFLSTDLETSQGLFTIRQSIRDVLAAEKAARRAVVQTLPDPNALFAVPRTPETAEAAYRLALMTADVFFRRDAAMYSSWGFRQAVYHLKIAQLRRRYFSSRGETEALGEARALVEEHGDRFSGAQYFYALFLRVALAERLEGRAGALVRFEHFRELRERFASRLEGRLRLYCDDYFGKARELLGLDA